MFAAPPLLNLVVIRSADLDRAERFYGVLGIGFERHRHGKGPEHLAGGPYKDGYVFEIYPANAKVGSTAGVRIGFNMDGVDDYIQRLVEAGGTVIEAPADSEWGRRAVVADPDGHRVELVTPPDREARLLISSAHLEDLKMQSVERLIAYSFHEIQLRSANPKAVAALAYACHNLPTAHRNSHFDMDYFRGWFGTFHDEYGFMFDYLTMLDAIERGVAITFEMATGKWGSGLNGGSSSGGIPPVQ